MRRCMRKWYLSHYRQLKPRSDRLTEPITLGNLVHEPLAQWYNTGQDPLATLVYESEMLIQEQEDLMSEDLFENAISVIEQNIETVEKMRDFAKIILEGYLEWLEEEGADSYLTFVSAEEEMSVPMPVENLPEPIALLAKLDTRFIDQRSNARVFMDHKTVQNFPDREKWAHKDPQFLFYSMVEYLSLSVDGQEVEEGTWTDGGILNMLRKVKRTARSTPPFYKRKDVRHSTIELRNFFIRLTGEVTRILQTTEMLDKGVSHMLACPPSPTSDCSWDCRYMTLCDFMDDGSDSEGYIEASYTVTNPLERYESVSGLRVV